MSIMPSGFHGANLPDLGDVTPLEVTGTASTPAAVPGRYDVSAVATADLVALERDPATKLLGFTIDNARVNYADTIARGGRVLVTTSAGNGGKPVVVIVPPGFDPGKPARVHTHYHGFNATVADPKGHGSGTTARIEEAQAADPQTVFVLPECGNAPAQTSRLDDRGAYATKWSNVSSVPETNADALSAAGITDVGLTVVSAHSGGGAALASAIDAHPDGSGLACDRLELLDCLYGSEKQLAAWSKTQAGHAVASVTYYHGTNTDPDTALKKGFASRWLRVNVAPPKPADDPQIKDARGNPIRDVHGHARTRYALDAHNRTNAQFMDDRTKR